MKKIIMFIFISIFLSVLLKATNLNPVQTVYITSITYSWDNLGTEYNIVLSTNENFETYISSEIINTNTTTYFSLKGNTTYYFKVKISTEPDSNYNTISTLSYAAKPENIQIISNIQYSTSASLTISFDKENDDNTKYEIVYSTDENLISATTIYQTAPPPLQISELLTNTTYYLKIRAIDKIERKTDFSSLISTQTVSRFPDYFSITPFITSTTFNWNPVNGTNNEEKTYAYEIIISTKDNFETIFLSTYITNIDLSNHLFEGLSEDSTYYYIFSSINSIGIKNSKKGEIHTLVYPPQNLKLISYSSSSVTLSFDKPSLSHGYVIKAEDEEDNSYILSTNNPDITTITLIGLLSNTTYYFKAGNINHSGDINFSLTISTITLSQTIDVINYSLTPKSITASFQPLPLSPEYLRTYGYRLDISTTNFIGGVIYSSYTNTSSTANIFLSITNNILPNTSYYARLYTFNSAGEPNFSKTTLLLTPLPQFNPEPILTYKSSNTITITYITTDSTKGYSVEASTDKFFNVINFTSLTYSNEVSTLSITGLIPDTLYYLRHGLLFEGTTIYTSVYPSYTRTLTPPPENFTLTDVFISSIGVLWTTVTSRGYIIEVSTTNNFISKTLFPLLSPVQNNFYIKDLNPNTSYYFKIASLNFDDEPNYSTTILSTATLANFPLEITTEFEDLTTGSMKIKWQPNSNPSDTLYLVEISSTNFLDSIHSSYTHNNSATFYDLLPNTTYYKKITAYNRYGIPTGPVSFTPVATLAYKPLILSTSITVSSQTIYFMWDNNNNSDGTLYLAEVSSDDFQTSITSYTLLLSATFYNLNGNTPYKLRVRAINYSNIPSETDIFIATTNVKTPKPLENTFINVLLDGFTAQWDNNTNSTYTIYIVESSTDSNFNYIFKSTQTRSTLFVFPDLNPKTKYYVRLKAKGINNEESEYLILGEIETLFRQEKTINHQITQISSIPYSYGSIEVEVPPYSLGSVTRLFIEPELNPPPPSSKAAKLIPTGFATKIWIYPEVLYTGKIFVKIPFKNISQSILDKLVVARYDERTKLWTPLTSYRENNRIIGETYHFSIFQIMQITESEALKEPKIYPNPWKPNTILGNLKFSNIPARTEIYIYTLTGELVKKLIANDSGFIEWDGKNEKGRSVSSGVYIVILKSGNEKIIKKLGIEK